MNVMHILAKAETGGIETLCKDYDIFSKHNNIFVVLWGVNGVTAKTIKQNGGMVLELNSNKKNIIKVYKQLCAIVKEYSIDAVVVHHAASIMHIYMHLLKAKYNNLITIAYAHGAAEDMCRHNDRKGLALRKFILSKSLKKSMRVIAISNWVKNSLISYFNVPSNKIVVLYNGTNTSRFVSNLNEKNEMIKLIYVGRLVKEKGVQTTLQCLNMLPKNLKWTFDIVGDGSFRQNLEQQTVEFDLTDRVQFLGSRNDIPELLKTHDLFIHMPAWDEGFGITVIEAMASGLLCICYAKGGIPEIIENGKNGILVHSEEELIDTLNNLLNKNDYTDINLIRKMAVERAKSFDIRIFSKKLDDLIDNL